MLNSTHLRLAETGARLIANHGRELKLLSISSTGEAWDPAQTETETTVMGVQSRFKQAEIDGDLVRSTDRLYLLGAAASPDVTQRLKDGAVSYSIVSINEVKPGNVVCLYKVQARL